MSPQPDARTPWLAAGTLVLLAILVWSGWHPFDRATWVMETVPAMIGIPLLWLAHRRLPLTTLLYVWIGLWAVVLMVGGAYSYARVPFGFTLRDLLGLERNPYDRIGHFVQGIVPALIAREIFVRGRWVRRGWMLHVLTVCTVLAFSATYEFIEWGSALALGSGADEFLGTQGDPWDTQSDMFSAVLGSIASIAIFSRVHDRQLAAFD